MENDPVLNQIGLFVHWPVQRTEFGYRIRCTEQDIRKNRIAGIAPVVPNPKRTAYCPRLNTDQFDSVPICFEIIHVDQNDPRVLTEIHYYTLNRDLHRAGRPARYQIGIHKGLRYVEMCHFWHGYRHCAEGPAEMTITDAREEPIRDSYGNTLSGPIRISAKEIEFGWFEEGARCEYPRPSQASLKDVRLTFDHLGRYSDFEGQPALQARTGSWWWTGTSLRLMPKFIEITEFRESYRDGKYLSRTGEANSVWMHGQITSGNRKEFPPPGLLEQVDLWGKSFSDPVVQLRLSDELERLIKG